MISALRHDPSKQLSVSAALLLAFVVVCALARVIAPDATTGLAAVPGTTLLLFSFSAMAAGAMVTGVPRVQAALGAALIILPVAGWLPAVAEGLLATLHAYIAAANAVTRVCFSLVGVAILFDAILPYVSGRSALLWFAATANFIVSSLLLLRWLWNTEAAIDWQTPDAIVLQIGTGLLLLGIVAASMAHYRTGAVFASRRPGLHLVGTVVVVVPVGVIILLLQSAEIRHQLRLQQQHNEYTALVTRHNLIGLGNVLSANVRGRFTGEDRRMLVDELDSYLSEITVISRLGLVADDELMLSYKRAPGCDFTYEELLGARFNAHASAAYAATANDFLIRVPLPDGTRQLFACVDLGRAKSLWLPQAIVDRYDARFVGAPVTDSVDAYDAQIRTGEPLGLGGLYVVMETAVVPVEYFSPQLLAVAIIGLMLLSLCNWGIRNYVAQQRQIGLSESRRSQLEAVLDNITQGVAIVSGEGLTLLSNPSLRNMTGKSEDELLALHLREYLTPEQDENAPEFQQKLERLLVASNESLRRLTCRLVSDGIHHRRVEVTAIPVAVQGHSRALLLLISDFTGIDAMELQIREHNERLSDVNRELEEFSYMASHDLREPLRTITSFVKLLRRNLGDSMSEQVAEDLHYIEDAVARTNLIIAGLLQLSRAGRRELDIRPVEPAAFIDPALEQLHGEIKATGAAVTVESDGKTVSLDAHLFEQLVTLLVSNSLKFQPDGNVPQVIISAAWDDGAWYLRVSDNGIGIAPQFHSMIFGSFKRLHGISEYPGTGSGLAVVKKIAERHQATVHVESDEGKGATFVVTVETNGA